MVLLVLKQFLFFVAASYSDSYSSDEDDGSPRDKTQVMFYKTHFPFWDSDVSLKLTVVFVVPLALRVQLF